MPRIFDNIAQKLQSALIQTLDNAQHADFCVGYFNLRGWRLLQPHIDGWQGGDKRQVRLLIGMHRTPQEDIRTLFSLSGKDEGLIDNQRVLRLRRQIVEDFRQQLMLGAPTNADEQGLRGLCPPTAREKGRRQALSALPPARQAVPAASTTHL